MRHRKSLGVLAGLSILAAAATARWPLAASSPDQSTPAKSASAVRSAPEGLRAGAKPGEKGATYFAFESQAIRQVARYADATAVTERAFDGDLQTTVTTPDGAEVGRLKFDRVDGVNDVIRYTPRSGPMLQAFAESSVRPTLDWSSHQAYALWKDKVDGSTQRLEWRGGMIRGASADGVSLEKGVIELQTEWANGLTARTVRKQVSKHTAAGREMTGDVMVTHLTRNGTEAGLANWYPAAQVLMWNLPGLTKGYIAPEHLTAFGGWPFVPDMAWLNLQVVAFHHYKTEIQAQGFVAGNQPGWGSRLLQFLAPALQANEPGCDDLHWLDGSIYRFCCDVHDRCYEKNGCTSRSWWRFWSSWTCTYCNMGAVYCFLTGGTNFPDEGFRQ